MRCNPWLGVTPLEIKGGPVEVNRTHTTVEMAHKYKLEHGKTEVTLTEEFKHHMTLFSDKEANKFPPTWGNGDHKIILMDTAPTHFNCKIYPLSRDEQDTENKFINENLDKGYIVPLDSPYGFSTFTVPKKRLKGEKIHHWLLPPEHSHQKGCHPTPQPQTVYRELVRNGIIQQIQYSLGIQQHLHL